MFPLSLVNDPTSVISDDKKDAYNNILLFTVFEDKVNSSRKKSAAYPKNGNTPSEMHIFQCTRTHSAESVDEIYRAKEGRRSQTHVETGLPKTVINEPAVLDEITNVNTSVNATRSSMMHHRASHKHTSEAPLGRIDIEVQILNHCFDDIERFVTRLQNSSEYFRELEKRQKRAKSPSKHKVIYIVNFRNKEQRFFESFSQSKNFNYEPLSVKTTNLWGSAYPFHIFKTRKYDFLLPCF